MLLIRSAAVPFALLLVTCGTDPAPADASVPEDASVDAGFDAGQCRHGVPARRVAPMAEADHVDAVACDAADAIVTSINWLAGKALRAC